MSHSRIRLLFIFLSLTFAGVGAWACSVPVFRYALEHWSADPFEAFVFHRGPLSGTDGDTLRKLTGGHGGHAGLNIAVHDVDLAQAPPAEMIEAWKRAGSPEKPWLVIGSPRSRQQDGSVYSAALNGKTADMVAGSPARDDVTRRLGEGESAVWVLLESGDTAKDDAVAKMVEERLTYLASVMELPKLDEQDIKNGLVSVPADGLRLAFSVLRVARTDPAEAFFVQTLLASERDLKASVEPMMFPVFGQARVLYALVGPGINRQNIDKAAGFLVGSCSCQVKEQNPGTDLLVAADWRTLLKDQALGVQDLPKTSDIIGKMPESATILPKSLSEQAHPTAEACSPVMGWMKAHVGLAASIALLGCLLPAFGIARFLRNRASS